MNLRRAFALPLLAGVCISLYYAQTVTSPRPSLYLAMSEQILQNGYHLPITVPHYTANGIPFAYPPLGFYTIAVISDVTPLSLRASELAIRFIAYPLAIGALALAITSTTENPTIGAATGMLAGFSPKVFWWQLGHGGGVRSLAFLFMGIAIWAGDSYYRTHEPKFAPLASVSTGLCALTHPVFATVPPIAICASYVARDRSLHGGTVLAGIGAGSLLLISPWLATVLGRHGLTPFIHASQTHGGLFSVPQNLWGAAIFITKSHTTPVDILLVYLAIPTGLYLIYYRDHLPLVVLAGGVLVFRGGHGRFLVPVAVGIAIAGFYTLARRHSRLQVYSGVLTVVVLTAAVTGGAAMQEMPQDSFSKSDAQAMNWVAESTAPDAVFVVDGPEEELPYYADRETLLVPWGAEWEGQFVENRELLLQLRRCSTPACFSSQFDSWSHTPDYVYTERQSINTTLFSRSDRFRLVYKNQQVVIYKVQQLR